MMRTFTLILIAWALALTVQGQPVGKDSLALRVAELHAVLDQADTLMSEEAWSDTMTINYWIEQRLLRVLAIPMADSTLERVTTHDFLHSVHSKDGKLWTFNWYENTGGSFHSFCHLFFHRTADGHGIAIGDDESFCDSRAPISEIHKLRSKSQPGLYLAMGSVRGCNSCCGNVAVVFQLIGDSLNMNYPAFVDDDIAQPSDEEDEDPTVPCYLLGARCGDLPLWEFDAKRQRINYVFVVDDLSPMATEDPNSPGMVRGTLQFTGARFIETAGEIEPNTYQQR